MFCNNKMLTNIRKVDDSMALKTNAGHVVQDEKGTVPGCDEVWYNNQAMTNVMGLNTLIKKCRVTYDSAKENCFLVHAPHGVAKFERDEMNLCSVML